MRRDDPLYSSRYSIAHAERRLQELELELAAFRDSRPYSTIVEPDVNRAENVHKGKLSKPMPVALPGIVGDVLHNLRSALDQAGYAVAIAAGSSGRDAKFPFGDSEAEVLSRRKGQSKNIPQEIFDVMAALQPYKGGNDLLWALNKACNSNKHEIIVPVIVAVGNSTMDPAWYERMMGIRWPPQWDSTKDEIEFARVPIGTTPQVNFQLTTFIAFGQIDGIDGKPIATVLRAMSREVERGCMAIKGEARRLGLFS